MKLSPDTRSKIINDAKDSTVREVAKKYGIAPQTIYKILRPIKVKEDASMVQGFNYLRVKEERITPKNCFNVFAHENWLV